VSATTVVLAVLLGVAAGLLAGSFGVGGGILFVPTLLGLGLTQLEAEATVLAGTWRQRHYGNVHWRAALALGVASIAGAVVGVRIATSIDEDLLRRLFALLLLGVAGQLAWRCRHPSPYPSEP
jgi:uncharacterized membrane protein YfcA